MTLFAPSGAPRWWDLVWAGGSALVCAAPLLALSWILLTLWLHPLKRFVVVVSSVLLFAAWTSVVVLIMGQGMGSGEPPGLVCLAAGLLPSSHLAAALWKWTRSAPCAASPFLGTGFTALMAWLWPPEWSPLALPVGATAWHAVVMAGLCYGRHRVRQSIPQRRRPINCRCCGYDRRGLPTEVCPECGLLHTNPTP